MISKRLPSTSCFLAEWGESSRGRGEEALLPGSICCISRGRVCFPRVQLTVRHILHSCDHRASQVNGAQRVVALVARLGWAGWGVSVSRRGREEKKKLRYVLKNVARLVVGDYPLVFTFVGS